jgi:hypothetical protein
MNESPRAYPYPNRQKENLSRLDQFQFYVDTLTNIERSKLAARYIRKVPPQYRFHLLKRLTIPGAGLP